MRLPTQESLEEIVGYAYTTPAEFKQAEETARLNNRNSRSRLGPPQDRTLANLLRNTLAAAVVTSVFDKEHGPFLTAQMEEVAARILTVPKGFATTPGHPL